MMDDVFSAELLFLMFNYTPIYAIECARYKIWRTFHLPPSDKEACARTWEVQLWGQSLSSMDWQLGVEVAEWALCHRQGMSGWNQSASGTVASTLVFLSTTAWQIGIPAINSRKVFIQLETGKPRLNSFQPLLLTLPSWAIILSCAKSMLNLQV